MSHFVYPESWKALALSPEARAELISFVGDVAEWNEQASNIKTHGADDLIGFFYDTFALPHGARNLVGQIIFSDEVEQVDRFFREFDKFLNEWQQTEHELGRLHKAILPYPVTEEARNLLRKLQQRGGREWRN
jgi:hypothetical protein